MVHNYHNTGSVSLIKSNISNSLYHFYRSECSVLQSRSCGRRFDHTCWRQFHQTKIISFVAISKICYKLCRFCSLECSVLKYDNSGQWFDPYFCTFIYSFSFVFEKLSNHSVKFSFGLMYSLQLSG